MIDLFDELRSAQFMENKQAAGELVGALSTVDILVLDDLGKQRPTPYAYEKLFQIVDNRYEARKHIIVTSNLGLPQIGEQLGDTGVSSRLGEMAKSWMIDLSDLPNLSEPDKVVQIKAQNRLVEQTVA